MSSESLCSSFLLTLKFCRSLNSVKNASGESWSSRVSSWFSLHSSSSVYSIVPCCITASFLSPVYWSWGGDLLASFLSLSDEESLELSVLFICDGWFVREDNTFFLVLVCDTLLEGTAGGLLFFKTPLVVSVLIFLLDYLLFYEVILLAVLPELSLPVVLLAVCVFLSLLLWFSVVLALKMGETLAVSPSTPLEYPYSSVSIVFLCS